MLIRQIRTGLLATIAVSLIACQEPTAPDAGKITVVVSVTGIDIDRNAFVLRIDGKAPQTIVAGTPITLEDLPSGSYNLRLDGVAANCAVAGTNPRSATVTASRVTSVAFQVLCTQATGGVVVSIQATGVEVDADYSLVLDQRPSVQLRNGSSTSTNGLAPGEYEIQIGDVASNCAIARNPRTVRIVAGEIASTTFDVLCIATVGGIRITITATGSDVDDAYTLTLWTGPPIQVVTNDTITFSDLTPGDYSLRLRDVAPNCAVSQKNPLKAPVAAGEVTTLKFSLVCVPIVSGGDGTEYVLETVNGVDLPVWDLSGRGWWDDGDYVLELTGQTMTLHNDGTYTNVDYYREVIGNSIRYFTETVHGVYQIIDASKLSFGTTNRVTGTITPSGMIVNRFNANIMTYVRVPG